MNAALESRHARGQALTALLGSLSTLGPFSNDSVLPVFPSVQSEFAVSDLEMQQVLTVYTIGMGAAMPSLMLLVLDLMPERRGFASAVIGFAQSGSSAVLAGAVSHLVSGSARSLALCSLVIFACGLVCWLGYLARLAVRVRNVRA